MNPKRNCLVFHELEAWRFGGVAKVGGGENHSNFSFYPCFCSFFLLFPCILYVEKPVWPIFASFLGSPSQRCTVTRNDFSASPTVKNV